MQIDFGGHMPRSLQNNERSRSWTLKSQGRLLLDSLKKGREKAELLEGTSGFCGGKRTAGPLPGA